MKNKRIIIIIAIILITIIVSGIILVIKNNNKEKTISDLQQIYDDLLSRQSYLFVMEKDSSNKTTMAKKDNKTLIDQYYDVNRTTTLVKDDNTYLILHERQEYYVYKGNNVEQNILTDGIKEILDKKFTFGTEKVKGKKYSYEEYEGSTMFTLSNKSSLNDNNVKTRLYFDKSHNLAYVKTIYTENEELLKVNLSYEVEDSLFEIPSNYAEN